MFKSIPSLGSNPWTHRPRTYSDRITQLAKPCQAFSSDSIEIFLSCLGAFVLDEKYRSGFWQNHRKSSTLAELAIDGNCARHLLDDVFHNGKA